MVIDSETVFEIGKSDELVDMLHNRSNGLIVYSGLKSLEVRLVEVEYQTKTIITCTCFHLPLVGSVQTRKPRRPAHRWVKMNDIFFRTNNMDLSGSSTITEDKGTINLFRFRFTESGMTFEEAVSHDLQTPPPVSKDFFPSGGRFESTPSDPTELGRRLRSQLKVDFSTMGWKDVNHVVEFPKVKITKHEE